MSRPRGDFQFLFAVAATLLSFVSPVSGQMRSQVSSIKTSNQPFNVAEEIELALFNDPTGGPAEVLFSPDGNYFAVKTERGRLNMNRVEDTIRFFRTEDIKKFLDHSDESQPSPVWSSARTCKEGAVIGRWRWLADSSGVAFMEPTENGKHRLMLTDLQKKTVEPLTSATEAVQAFDVRDRQHYVYSVADSTGQEKKKVEREAAASIVGTGRSLFDLILPDDPITARIAPSTVSLWAVVGSKRFEVQTDGAPLGHFGRFALSPDGRSLVTTLPVIDVPSAWEKLYLPPPSTVSANRIHAGHYDAKSSHVHQYVQIDLQTGAIQSLTDAPLADDAGWLAIGDPSWSDDGREILLPNTFLESKENALSRPCVAVMDVSSRKRACIEVLKAHKTETSVEEGYHLVWGAHFAGGGIARVMVAFLSHDDQTFRTTEYHRTIDNAWQVVKEIKGGFPAENNGLEVSVTQGLNEGPLLIARNKRTSRVIWDPNPQLHDFHLGEATVYTWKDKAGRQWEGGLYKPVNYRQEQRYPLVIQTHGFNKSEFRPSGVFPTAFAARALAATGIMVLQTVTGVSGGDNCPSLTPEEGPCAVAILESAVNQLVLDGLVDPQRIGIVGFSRTCFYVMEMLTTSSVHLKAASITDGVMFDYLQYIMFADRISGEADRVISAPPYGEGLQQWLRRSPGFNLDKIDTPLLIVGEGPVELAFYVAAVCRASLLG